MAIRNVMQLLQLGAPAGYGCDISYYQGDIDFVAMKKAGIKAVIIRAGYGTTIDKHFISYINAAVRAGLAIGVYWFIYAADTAGAINNARKCLEVIAPYRQYITLGVWADWEYDSDKRAGALTPYARSEIVDIFNCEIEEAGYEAGVYSNQDYIQSGKFQTWLVAKYPLWFAKYAASMSIYALKGKNRRPYMWQYSSSGDGKIYGVSSAKLDMNDIYIDLIPKASVPPSDKVSQNPNVIKSSDNPYPEPTRMIYYIPGKANMYGDDVKWVQWHLWRFGLFLDGTGLPDATQIDGKWGSLSDKALETAQGGLGLKQDKKCGSLSRQAFKEV